jgi:hypothetical protein
VCGAAGDGTQSFKTGKKKKKKKVKKARELQASFRKKA